MARFRVPKHLQTLNYLRYCGIICLSDRGRERRYGEPVRLMFLLIRMRPNEGAGQVALQP
jgi:hypothetical protein